MGVCFLPRLGRYSSQLLCSSCWDGRTEEGNKCTGASARAPDTYQRRGEGVSVTQFGTRGFNEQTAGKFLKYSFHSFLCPWVDCIILK